ncbi:hypothetical protein [Ralstonia solanacearum]|uniref:hypothetical protein n=1 Tax=Ralstonia solanacearum TaxID=305 RepID=UPI0013DDADBE|nr:hypothetical protein [Ralstonia solanacearum]
MTQPAARRASARATPARKTPTAPASQAAEALAAIYATTPVKALCTDRGSPSETSLR